MVEGSIKVVRLGGGGVCKFFINQCVCRLVARLVLMMELVDTIVSDIHS